jgi:hypothetical protein
MSGLEAIVTVGAFLGAVVGLIKARQGKRVFAVVSGVCALVALTVAVRSLFPASRTPASERPDANRFRGASGEVLGAHLADTVPDGKALIVVQPEPGGARPGSGVQATLDGLSRGFGDRIEIVDVVAPPPTDAFLARVERLIQSGELSRPEASLLMVRYEQWFDRVACNRFLESYGDSVNLVVFTIALPAHFALPNADRMAVALLNTSVRPHRRLIENGVIDAAVTLKPDPQSWGAVDRVPKDVHEAFAMRYLLVTPENVRAVAAAHPGLFE